MNKIAQGTTGQANSTPVQRGIYGNKSLYIYKDRYGTVYSRFADGTVISNPPGWNLTTEGVVTVPLGELLHGDNRSLIGSYTAVYESNEPAAQGGFKEYHYAFEVVCLTAEISATEIVQAAGVVRYECRAIVTGSTGPYQYTWSTQGGTIISGQGTSVAVVDFPPNTSGSVSLSVNDPSCSATDSIPIAASPISFTMTRPTGSGTGDKTGTRDSMHFTVVVEAVANGAIPNPPSTISFQLRRTSANGVDVAQLTGELVAGVNPPTYRGFWNVTKAKGRWNIQVESPHRSNSVNFKVDKRGQIVEVAESWVGAAQHPYDETPPQTSGYHGGSNCDDLARYVYGYVGIVAGGGATVTDLFNSMSPNPDSQIGSIWFYRDVTTGAYQHNGINIGGNQTVDQNCGHPHSLGQLPTVNTHEADDTNLVNRQKYSTPVALSPNELQQLDNE